jgi:hypothetical protein
MAKQGKNKFKTPQIRKLTICRKGFTRKTCRCVFLPSINLSGKWLQQNGFKSGQVIDIACEKGKLVITVAKEQRFAGI